jgi:hypothetical protein
VAKGIHQKPASEVTRSALFGTAELFEQIFLRLDMKTLLLSQRVSKEWRDFITQTTSLQKKLFFQPIDLKAAIRFSKTESHLQDLFITQTPLRPGLRTVEERPWVVMRNPLLLKNTQLASYSSGGVGSWRRIASWRRMLYTQPPQMNVAGKVHFIVAQPQPRWINYANPSEPVYQHYKLSFDYVENYKLNTMGDLMNAIDDRMAINLDEVDWSSARLYLRRIRDLAKDDVFEGETIGEFLAG